MLFIGTTEAENLARYGLILMWVFWAGLLIWVLFKKTNNGYTEEKYDLYIKEKNG